MAAEGGAAAIETEGYLQPHQHRHHVRPTSSVSPTLIVQGKSSSPDALALEWGGDRAAVHGALPGRYSIDPLHIGRGWF